MEELINQLVNKVGLDRATAEKVVGFLKEHAAEVPQWLASSDLARGLKDKLPGALGGLFGK